MRRTATDKKRPGNNFSTPGRRDAERRFSEGPAEGGVKGLMTATDDGNG
jgi:hypothetical protein